MNTIVLIIGIMLIFIGIIMITKKNNYIIPSIMIILGTFSIIGTYINDIATKRQKNLLTDFTQRRDSTITYALDEGRTFLVPE